MSLTDNPIVEESQDRLGRTGAAHAFARQLMRLDVSDGAVTAVLGPWGSGKTSFLNLARPDLEESGWKLIDFNPWMFSGSEQLLEAFFVEIVAQLRTDRRFKALTAALSDYGDLFSSLGRLPAIGPWIQLGTAIGKTVQKVTDRRREGLASPREKLRKLFSSLDHPIGVVIDDLDRLRSEEVRDIFKLVRLTASFPNLVYVLLFDRIRVEQALAEEQFPGRDYLEKIVQWGIDLPAIGQEFLDRETFTALDVALSGLDDLRLDSDAWADIFAEVVRPLIRHLRDVKRYAASVQSSASSLGGNVALADVLALEAIRVFLPEVFAQLWVRLQELTSPSTVLAGARDPVSAKANIEALITAGGDRAPVVERLIWRLFPAAQRHLPGGGHYANESQSQWLKGRRVAHPEILQYYLERVAGQGFSAFLSAERALTLASNIDELDAYARAIPAEERTEVIAALENWEGEFPADAAVPLSIVLLDLIPDLSERERGVFATRPDLVVGRVVLRVLRGLGGPGQVAQAVGIVLPKLGSLSSKLALITLVGHMANAGHKLIGEDVAVQLESDWRNEVRRARPQDLATEWDLLRVLYVARKNAAATEPILKIARNPSLDLAILRASAGYARSQSLGSRAVRRTLRLAWDALVEIFGSEREVKAALGRARKAATRDDSELLNLVDQYLGGWRPKDFDN